MRILLVDDDKEIRFALASVFQAKHKYTVIEACSGHEAIYTLTKQPDVSLIISDFQMPGGNGDVIVDYLRKEKVEVPLIFFSASQEVKSISVAAPILKSFSKSEVFHLIEYVEAMGKVATSRRAVV